jgi:hypothetical protein
MRHHTLASLAIAMLLAGCSGSDPGLSLDAEPVERGADLLEQHDDQAPTTAAVLSAAPATTEPPAADDLADPDQAPSDRADADAAPVDNEAAVLAVHARVMGELFARDERINGPEARLPLAEELTTGPLLRRIQGAVARNIETGERDVSDGYDSNVLNIDIDAESSLATVLDCSRDRGSAYSAIGDLIVEEDDFWKVRRVEYQLLEERWLAIEMFVGGDHRCDPDS